MLNSIKLNKLNIIILYRNLKRTKTRLKKRYRNTIIKQIKQY